MQSFPFSYSGHLELIVGEMLRVEDKKQRKILVGSGYVEGAERIEADIVVAYAEDNGNQSVQFGVDWFEHVVDCVPAVVAAAHGVVVCDISAQDYYVGIEIY